jgi:hypothetical protein
MTNPNISAPPVKRTCSNCACFARAMPDGSVVEPDSSAQGMLVCRRDTPAARLGAKEIPVMLDGKPVIDRGRPRMERVQVVEIGYKPVIEEGVCFDGWRPLTTLPGASYRLESALRHLLPIIAELARGNSQAARKLADGMLADMLADGT